MHIIPVNQSIRLHDHARAKTALASSFSTSNSIFYSQCTANSPSPFLIAYSRAIQRSDPSPTPAAAHLPLIQGRIFSDNTALPQHHRPPGGGKKRKRTGMWMFQRAASDADDVSTPADLLERLCDQIMTSTLIEVRSCFPSDMADRYFSCRIAAPPCRVFCVPQSSTSLCVISYLF